MDRKLKAAMILRGITQKQLAEKSGMSYNTLSMKLNGHYDFTRREMITISKVLDKPIMEIFFDEVVN